MNLVPLGTLTRDTDLAAEGAADFVEISKIVIDSFKDASVSFVDTVYNDAIEKIKENYGAQNYKPSKSEVVVTHSGVLTLKGDGSIRGASEMDLSDPTVQTELKAVINDKNIPSAVVGGKNL
jgi:hypothetical protein